MNKLEKYPLCCYTIAKTMNIIQNNIFNDDELFFRFQKFELFNYDIDEYCISFIIKLDSIGKMKINKYIFNTNYFDVLLEVFTNNKIEICFLNHKLYFLVDELNHIPTITLKNLMLKLEYLIRKPIINIIALSYDTLSQANQLRDSIFLEIPSIEQNTLNASLDKDKYLTCYKDNKIKTMKYYVACTHNKKVAGLIGLYEEIGDSNDICWVGWFCVDKNYRGFKIGKDLLDFIIKKAKSIGKKYIHLYTYDDKKFSKAKEMYINYGFKQYKPSFKIGKKDLYFKLKVA